ncbi:MAG: UDP-glucose/GDP-mannose dehydrogenase family protein [Planctomycetaceae bacterium]|jgi:UDPglucose 6-dehydrogenase|nr:UDP-glucose/GDP-mannose dehydrogenase family protein [Planctomycetaceae bacterium]
MRIVIVGTGYVGLVTGTCFAEMGNRVICVDHDAAKVDMLQSGKIPIYEPGLEEMVIRNSESGELTFSTNLAASLAKAQVVFIAVGTPMGEDGSADLQAVLGVAESIGNSMTTDLVVADKSTVPVGTADRVRDTIQKSLQKRIDAGEEKAASYRFDVVSNPEFLKEGTAVADFMKPDRVVIGADNDHAREVMETLYDSFMRKGNRILSMDVRSAEMTKYAANAMLATRISFMNELARLCEKAGANVSKVRVGIGMDSRIGSAFLFPGCGYGGSCFPKDVQALMKTMEDFGVTPRLLRAVDEVNKEQKKIVAQKIIARFGEDLTNRVFALWGLAFKPNTDDMREAPAVTTIHELVSRGASVKVFDPEAMEQAKKFYFTEMKQVTYCKNKYEAVDQADALLLLTEWLAFRSPDFDEIKERLKTPVIVDGRNQFERFNLVEQGFEYYAIGLPGTKISG